MYDMNGLAKKKKKKFFISGRKMGGIYFNFIEVGMGRLIVPSHFCPSFLHTFLINLSPHKPLPVIHCPLGLEGKAFHGSNMHER